VPGPVRLQVLLSHTSDHVHHGHLSTAWRPRIKYGRRKRLLLPVRRVLSFQSSSLGLPIRCWYPSPGPVTGRGLQEKKVKCPEKGRGGRGSIARARFRRQLRRLGGIQRPLFTVWWNIDTWTQSARPNSGCASIRKAVETQWATARLLADSDPRGRCWPAFPAARRRHRQ
jgi:hypothetical protein